MPDALLVIEDEPLLGAELQDEFKQQGWDAYLAPTIKQARQLLLEQDIQPLVVLSDMSMPDGNGLDLLEKMQGRDLMGEWIFLTAYGGVSDSVRALKLGAFDFLEKPCDPERLAIVVSGAARSARAQRRLRDEERNRSGRFMPEAFIGQSRQSTEVREMLARLSKVPFSALTISGETGSGKGLCARILHHSGARARGPLVEVNCAALPRDLLEAELFGHEAGAFTGAKGRHRGLIEQANGGSLFLDEIGELAFDLQAKLLKAIEDKRVRRLGGEREIEVDVQFITATNRDLERKINEASFRADLFHRLSVFRLDLPPLRERKRDIADLLPVFIQEFNLAADRQVEKIPEDVYEKLQAYDWPGNVRELRNVVERCVLLADSEVFPGRWLHLSDTSGHAQRTLDSATLTPDGRTLCLPLDGSMKLDEMECAILSEVLSRNSDNVSQSARVLGTTREKLRYRVQKYHLKVSDA
jgi:two-component system, NtrC family, response regulator AtoC